MTPCVFHMLEYHLQHLEVAADTIVLIVTEQLETERFMLFHQVLVPVVPAPLPEGLHRTAESLLGGFPLDHPIPLARLGPEVGETRGR